jgi:hypothetical protein
MEKEENPMQKVLSAAALALLFSLGIAGCEQGNGLEDAGEELDEAADEAQDE